MEELHLEVFDTEDELRSRVLRVLGQYLGEYHRFETGGEFRQLFVSLCDSDGNVCGGLLAYTHGEWLNVEFVWVSAAIRRQGFGTEMLLAAEAQAVERGCQRSYLDTACSSGEAFFLRRGYKVCGELPNYNKGQTRFWLWKSLTV